MIFDFGTGDPIEPTCRLHPQRRCGRQFRLPISQYPTVAGTPALRQAASDYLKRRFGVVVDPATQVLPSAGSKEAVFHLALAVVDPWLGRDTVARWTPATRSISRERCSPVRASTRWCWSALLGYRLEPRAAGPGGSGTHRHSLAELSAQPHRGVRGPRLPKCAGCVRPCARHPACQRRVLPGHLVRWRIAAALGPGGGDAGRARLP